MDDRERWGKEDSKENDLDPLVNDEMNFFWSRAKMNSSGEGLKGVRQAYKLKMVDVRGVIESFFIMLKENTYVLIRIELLVAVVTVIFLAMFIMDFYRCRTRSSVLITILKSINELSDQIVVYLIGAMQSAKFENQLFPVWAIVLVSLRTSLGYLSGYGIVDRERRYIEMANVIKFMGAGVLTGTRGLKYVKPLWSLWAILQLKSLYRYLAHDRAIKSLWHGRSSEFLPEYMRTIGSVDHEKGIKNADGNKSTMMTVPGDKYLICGESNQDITLKKPQYTMKINSSDESLVTLGKIREFDWLKLKNKHEDSNEHENRNEHEDSNEHEGNKYEELSMAFSLSRLLRCRLEDAILNKDSIDDMQNLILSRIIPAGIQGQCQEKVTKDEVERVFRILELELSFVKDYFYTLYPMVFWNGLGSLLLSLLLSTATFAIAFWLAVGIRKVYQPPAGNLVLWVHGCNFDIIMTWVFMFFMMFKEIWEMVTYMVSNWTRLLLACKYVQKQAWFFGHRLTKRKIRSFFRSKIAEPWHGRIDQYDFLQQSTYKPTLWKLAGAITLGKIGGKSDGKKAGEAIKIPQCVKPAILQAIGRISLTSRQLPREIPSLINSTIDFQWYEWTCLEPNTCCSQVILVWHIATSLCGIKLEHEKETNLTKPGFLSSAWSDMKEKLCSCSSQPYHVRKKSGLSDELKINYHIASSLSKYCAYLQAFRSELLPDSFLVPEVIFERTLKHAREQLDDCNLIWCRYNKLMGIAQPVTPGSVDKKLKMNNIVQQGGNLAKELISIKDDEARWKILAEFWADLLVHIAPSWNAADHKNNLESGGEFITLIWALLWHCGIEKSSLWHKDEVSEIIAQAPQDNSKETSNILSNKYEIESPEELKTRSFRRGRECRNGPKDTAKQSHAENEEKNGISSSSFRI
uniref:DUF4220 domain-containing protein n=1 Tax=Oryza punctata TaxID=4537 RepID=A0A0E0MCX2_ORYPU